MKKILLLLCLISGSLTAQNRENIKITHGPYLCDMTDSGVSIVWTTDKPALSWVELAPDGEDHFYGKERPKYFDTRAGRKRANDTVHHVRLNKLEAGTTYRYRVFSQEVLSWPSNDWVTLGQIASSSVYRKEPLQFTTFDNNKKEISFLVLNDIHGRAAFMKELCRDVDFKSLDFVLLNGDMTHWVEGQEQIFEEYMDTCVSMFASETPLVFNRGNHETRGVYADELIRYFPTRSGEFYYTFNIGKACFLVLDCGEDKPDSDIEYGGLADYDRYREEQAEWLADVLAPEEFLKASARIAFLHIPPALGTWHANYHLQETLMPLLNKAGIDIMLSGHTHRYSLQEADEKTAFPVLVNSNNNVMLCKLTDNKLLVEISGLTQEEKKRHEFSIRF